MFASVSVRPAAAQGSQPLDDRTEFTFNSPVEMPGVTLPPGTYVFHFVDASNQKKVIQVADKSSNKNYGMFMTINAIRPKASDDAELRFLETPAGKPAAVKTWWYPGNTIGREFIYPKSQARRLAAATNTNVLASKSDAETAPAATATATSANLEYVAPNGQESAVTNEMLNSVNNAAPTGGTAARNVPVQEGTSASNMAPSRSRLPRTNGMLPLLALMGLSSLAGGTSLRFRK
jgi:hypothetical protein